MKVAATAKHRLMLRARGHLINTCFGATFQLPVHHAMFFQLVLFRCKCEACIPHIIDGSPQGSHDLEDSDNSSDSEDATHIAGALQIADKLVTHQEAHRAVDNTETVAALLKAQKREAIRKAVEAQRGELDRVRKL